MSGRLRGAPGGDGARPAEQATAVTFTVALRMAEVDSTNRVVVEKALAGAAEGFVAVADHQTAGRGRLGRTWSAPAGSGVLSSLLFRPPTIDRSVHLLPVLVGLAARDAILALAGVEADLKWPNDLLVGERKVAGILAEVVPEQRAVVVGIGINVNWPAGWPPVDAGRGAEGAELERVAATGTALNRVVGSPVDREALLERLLVGVSERHLRLRAIDGGASLLGEYRKACATLGREVRVELAGESFDGRAVGVSEDCELEVETSRGTRLVGVGDVVHLHDN